VRNFNPAKSTTHTLRILLRESYMGEAKRRRAAMGVQTAMIANMLTPAHRADIARAIR
jgi:hypothetical protein